MPRNVHFNLCTGTCELEHACLTDMSLIFLDLSGLIHYSPITVPCAIQSEAVIAGNSCHNCISELKKADSNFA